MRKKSSIIVIVAALLVALVPGSALASSDAEQRFVELINRDRAVQGLGSLAVYHDLVDDARAHSDRMAAEGDIWHNPDLASVTDGWYALGENVGMGPNADILHDAFMDSSGHRANVLGDYNYVGVGVTVDGAGTMFVTVVFMRGADGLVVEETQPTLSVPDGFPVADSVGLHDPRTGIWTQAGRSGIRGFYYGNPADRPMACDWNGNGTATPGLYRSSTGFLHLRNSNTQGVSDMEIFYGEPHDLPVCGDWNGNGTETIGIFRGGTFHLRDSNTQGYADRLVHLGAPGDHPFAGDFSGDGVATVGVYRPSTGAVYLHGRGLVGHLGNPGDVLVTGDWDGDGRDGLGIYRPSTGTFYLFDRLGSSTPDVTVTGTPGLTPVSGSW